MRDVAYYHLARWFLELAAPHRGARGLQCSIPRCGIVSKSYLKAATHWTRWMSFWLEWFTVNAVVTWCRMTARGCLGFAWQGQSSAWAGSAWQDQQGVGDDGNDSVS